MTRADYFYSIDSLFNMLLVFQAEEVEFDDDFMALIKECVFQYASFENLIKNKNF